ncbi:unnamed protein product, partial [Meganyctiphanes norvegica]
MRRKQLISSVATIFFFSVFFINRTMKVSSDLMEEQEVRWRVQGPLPSNDPHLIHLLRDRYLRPPDYRPYNLSKGNYEYHKNDLEMGQDIRAVIKKMFSTLANGFFVEAGALDGEYLSNSLWLEEEMGWTGLLVEPNPFSYKDLLLKHRKAWSVNACLSTETYPKETVFVAMSPRDRNQRGAKNYHGASHELNINVANAETEEVVLEAESHYINTQCFPLESLLLAINVTTVDMFSLDIQGAERMVLASIPWDKLNIRVLVVENTQNYPYDESFVNEMSLRKYKLVKHVNTDYIFVKAD